MCRDDRGLGHDGCSLSRRDWREEVCAAEAAVWLDDAGLLRGYKRGLPLCSLLRAGRIAGQQPCPDRNNGSWWIRRLAESRDAMAIQQARQQIRRYLSIDRDILPRPMPGPTAVPCPMWRWFFREHSLRVCRRVRRCNPNQVSRRRPGRDGPNQRSRRSPHLPYSAQRGHSSCLPWCALAPL